MKVRQLKTKDFYNVVSKWWNNHQILHEGKKISYPLIPLSILPQNVFVVSDDKYDLYCIFFYQTDSAMSWLAYPTSNLEAPKKNRKGALEFLINEVERYAREHNYFLLFTTSPVKPVQDALLSVGFVIGDEKVSQFYKKLPPEN
ncbi:MAG: hypothetical protein QM499_00920 [Flavobacteriaceae bacterium]